MIKPRRFYFSNALENPAPIKTGPQKSADPHTERFPPSGPDFALGGFPADNADPDRSEKRHLSLKIGQNSTNQSVHRRV